MAKPALDPAENASDADAQRAIGGTWFGVALLRSTALAVLIASYLAAIGVVLEFFFKQFSAFKTQEPRLFWLILVLPAIFIVCFSVAPEAWRRYHQARRKELALREPFDPLAFSDSYFRLAPYVTATPSDFKREDQAHERLLRWLQLNTRPVLFLSGISGSGKSSILEAFAVPMLRQTGWLIVIIRSFSSPLTDLEDAIAAPRSGSARLLIIFDQFEEFVILEERTRAEDRQEFLLRVRKVCTTRPQNVTIVFVIRSDYLNSVIELHLDDLISGTNWMEIDPFRRGPARRFLENSPRRPGSELVERLLDGADALDEAPGLFRPVILNMLGLSLDEFDRVVSRRPEQLVQAYLERVVVHPSIREVAPSVIRRMISSKGTKLPRTIDELKQDTKLRHADVALCLAHLEAKLLVRRLNVNPGLWEISHDFVARQLGLVLGRLRPSPWPIVAIWISLVFFILVLVGVIAGVPLYFRQQASDDLRRAGIEITGDERLTVSFHGLELPLGLKRIVSDVALIGPVETLNLGNSGLTDVSPLKGLMALQVLNLEGSDVADISSLKGLPVLRTLNLSNSQVIDISPLKGLPRLQTLDLSNSKVVDISPLKGLPALQTLNLGETQVTDISPIKSLPGLHTLDLSNSKVVDISPLKGLPVLQTLNLGETQVTDISPLKGLPALQTLNLGETQVTDISPIKSLPGLHTLDLSHSKVVDISPLKGLPGLQTFKLSDTQVSDISPLKWLPALRTLDLSFSQLSDISPLKGLQALRTLDLSYSLVTDISPLKGLQALRVLNLEGTHATGNSPLKGLGTLDLTPLQGLVELQELDLENTLVTDISSLKGLSALQTLNLGGSQVTDISPLKGLSALQTLNLGNSQVTDISPLKGLQALHTLNLIGSKVTDIEQIRELQARGVEVRY